MRRAVQCSTWAPSMIIIGGTVGCGSSPAAARLRAVLRPALTSASSACPAAARQRVAGRPARRRCVSASRRPVRGVLRGCERRSAWREEQRTVS